MRSGSCALMSSKSRVVASPTTTDSARTEVRLRPRPGRRGIAPEPLGHARWHDPEREQRVLLQEPDADDPLGRRLDDRRPVLVRRSRGGSRWRSRRGGGARRDSRRRIGGAADGDCASAPVGRATRRSAAARRRLGRHGCWVRASRSPGGWDRAAVVRSTARFESALGSAHGHSVRGRLTDAVRPADRKDHGHARHRVGQDAAFDAEDLPDHGLADDVAGRPTT